MSNQNILSLRYAFLQNVPPDDQLVAINRYYDLAEAIRQEFRAAKGLNSDPLAGDEEALQGLLFDQETSGRLDTPGYAAMKRYRTKLEDQAALMGMPAKTLMNIILAAFGPAESEDTAGDPGVTFHFHLDLGEERRPAGTAEPLGEEYTFTPTRNTNRADDSPESELEELSSFATFFQETDIEGDLSKELLPDWLKRGLQKVADELDTKVTFIDYDGSSIYRNWFDGLHELSFTLLHDNEYPGELIRLVRLFIGC